VRPGPRRTGGKNRYRTRLTDTLIRKRSLVQSPRCLTRQGKVPIEAKNQRKGCVDPG
jgi:hypothetical protein